VLGTTGLPNPASVVRIRGTQLGSGSQETSSTKVHAGRTRSRFSIFPVAEQRPTTPTLTPFRARPLLFFDRRIMDVRITIARVRGQLFCWIWPRNQSLRVLAEIERFARDPDIQFTWGDAARVIDEVMKESERDKERSL
jgi:hypothetical protein